jgi:MFS family permease
MSLLAAVCLLTFLHYVGAQMRGPILPFYAAAHGATATGVGFIVAAHMAVAAAGSIPLGRASDVWGRRPLLLGGMVVTAVTSLLLPLFEGELALMTIYGLAGFGVAAFTPSALSLVGDAAAPARAGYAFAWYTTAHYGAIAFGPFLGGLAAQWWGYREAFVGAPSSSGPPWCWAWPCPHRPPRPGSRGRAPRLPTSGGTRTSGPGGSSRSGDSPPRAWSSRSSRSSRTSAA